MRKAKALTLGVSRLKLDEAALNFSSSSSLSNSFCGEHDETSWENSVASNGSLFYAEYVLHSASLSCTKTNVDKPENYKRPCSQRFEKKFAGRRQSAEQNNSSLDQQQSIPEKFRYSFAFVKPSNTDCKVVEMEITATNRFRFGRRSTAVESILGFRVVPFIDQQEFLMVDGFMNDINFGQEHNEQIIKRGDWFKSLNGIDIHTSNIDMLLQQFVEPTKVLLAFQSQIRNENNDSEPESHPIQWNKIENIFMFAQELEQILGEPNSNIPQGTPFFLLMLPVECYNQDYKKNVLYCYPEDPEKNFLYKARGSFLTLHAILKEELKTKPLTSRLIVDKITYYINYCVLNEILVLFAYPSWIASPSQSRLRSNELINYIQFAFPQLSIKDFGTSSRLNVLRNFCEIQRIRLLNKPLIIVPIEELLQESQSISLPKEAQLRIFDALSEMDAMDYRNWNDEPLSTHREFFIYGSMLYYKKYMLTSQLPIYLHYNVENYLRCNGVFDFITSETVSELLVWEEIQMVDDDSGRYFLVVCTRNHLTLSVILKNFDAEHMLPNSIISPSLFYIEEIQETLDHLIQCGIESLAMIWSSSNKRPEILDKFQLLNSIETSDTTNIQMESLLKLRSKVNVSNSSIGVTPIHEDEHRNSSVGGSSIHSDEDSSRKHLSSMCALEESDSDSDWENFITNRRLQLGLDSDSQNQMTESLCKEISNVLPIKICAGWGNVIFHSIYVNHQNGSLFCPSRVPLEPVTHQYSMNKSYHIIRPILHKSKQRPLQAKKCGINEAGDMQQMVIKEYGLIMEIKPAIKSHNNKETNIKLAVIGRYFDSAHREVYICHHPDVPQNLMETAFRLSFFSAG